MNTILKTLLFEWEERELPSIIEREKNLKKYLNLSVPKNINIFITGSSSKMSSKEIPTELRGRSLEEKISPLSFSEFLNFEKINIDFEKIEYLEDEKVKILSALNEYLMWGGLPEIVLSETAQKREIIQEYYKTVIRKDISERSGIKNEENLKALLLLLLNSTSYSISKLYNTLKSINYKIGKATLQKYLSSIENSFFLNNNFIFSYKIKNSLQYPRKNYFIDNGFVRSLSTKFSNNYSRLYENLVFIELQRRIDSDTEINYWKDELNKNEVDFVIRKNTEIVRLIQVCYDILDSDTKEREIKGIIKASKKLNCNNLLIINNELEKEEVISGKSVKFIPLWKWLVQDKLQEV